MACACGSGANLNQCCGPILDGAPAPTAEQLMRSRYTAFVLGNADYLLQSWHPKTRPSRVSLDDNTRWLSLQIVSTHAGQAQDDQGVVEFCATFMSGVEYRVLHEKSRFEKISGHWFYLDGDCSIDKPGRNHPCPCGSGKKFKRCCAANQG